MPPLPALLIVDMQNDFVLPGAPACVAGAYATVPAIRRAIDRFHERRWPVFHVVREYRADGSDIERFRLDGFLRDAPYVVPGTPGCEVVAAIAPEPGDYRIVKPRFSGFMQTELDFMLRRLGVTEVVVCGTQYPNCIRATVFDAVALGYGVTGLTDGTSAQTPAIAEANILDMRNIGVACIPLADYRLQ